MKEIIEKAIKNGWRSSLRNPEYLSIIAVCSWPNGTRYIVTYMEIYLSHEFAKNFFGEEETRGGPKWKFHLQQLVLMTNDEAIEYLKKHL